MSDVKTEHAVTRAGVGVIALTSSDEKAHEVIGILRELLPEAALAVASYATSANRRRRYSNLLDLDHMINREEHWVSWWSGEILHYVQDPWQRKKSILRLELWERIRGLVL
jgi:hypothetical protein